MPTTREFFESVLPAKLQKNAGLAASVKAVIQFDIAGESTWTVDLVTPGGAVREEAAAAPGCIITCAKADWEKMLENPSHAMQLFMMGKIKATNVGLAMQLQKILG